MKQNGPIARACASRPLTGLRGLAHPAGLEVRPRERVVGEDVIALGGRAFRDADGFIQLEIVFGEKSREERRLRRIEAPAGLGECVLPRGVGWTTEGRLYTSPSFSATSGVGVRAISASYCARAPSRSP